MRDVLDFLAVAAVTVGAFLLFLPFMLLFTPAGWVGMFIFWFLFIRTP